jgi:hypothetical protein
MRIKSVDVPQADTLGLVVKLLATIWPGGKLSKSAIASELGIDPRQVDYYKHAARILGFVRPDGQRLEFTEAGKTLMTSARRTERTALVREAALHTEIIERLLRDRRPEELSGSQVKRFLKLNTNLSGTTIPRRAHTILSWIHTVLDFDPFDPSSVAKKAAASAEPQFEKYQSHEEGYAHRTLKESIAADPQKYLGETLTLVQMEYPFPTNDRADVLFFDRSERFVVVEVEVDVGPNELPGLLQALKYKHMLALISGVRAENVRGMLVARSIAPAMKERALDYDIEFKEVRGVV